MQKHFRRPPLIPADSFVSRCSHIQVFLAFFLSLSVSTCFCHIIMLSRRRSRSASIRRARPVWWHTGYHILLFFKLNDCIPSQALCCDVSLKGQVTSSSQIRMTFISLYAVLTMCDLLPLISMIWSDNPQLCLGVLVIVLRLRPKRQRRTQYVCCTAHLQVRNHKVVPESRCYREVPVEH